MTDAELIADISTITDPIQMLEIIVDNEMVFGDPYYSDIRRALISNAERIVQEHRVSLSSILGLLGGGKMNRGDALLELVLAAESVVDLLNRWELVRQNSSAHTRLRDAISTLKECEK